MLTINQDSYVPPYAQLKSRLVEGIRRAEFGVGDKIPSIRGLSSQTGLAYQTVSKAISELIDEGVLVSRRGRGTFVADVSRIEAKNGTSVLNFGILYGAPVQVPVDPMASPFTAETCQTINEYASKHGQKITFVSTDTDPDAPLIRNAAPLDGLILLNADSHLADIGRWEQAGLPIVMINQPTEDYGGNFVGCNDKRGAYQAVKHLIELGHTRIACLKHRPEIRSYVKRFEGVETALREHGIELAEDMAVRCEASISSGHRATQELLDRSVPPTAIFACTDLAALGAINAILERDLHVPRDISVAGFMDLALLANYSLPLTTVRMHIRDMAMTAARFLEDIIKGHRDEPVQITMDPTLIIRDTTGKAPGAGGRA